MADAWTAPIGARPKAPDIASIIRSAQNSTEHAGDTGSVQAGLDGVAFRHTDVGDAVGGGSSLGRDALGSAALTAALTLHPCVFVSGVGDASREVLHSMFAQIGPCSVRIDIDEETERPIGEASATFQSAEHAIEAIRRFDGSRLNDGYINVSVSKRSAQGSLTTRGKGGGKGRGKAGGIAFSERQRDLIYDQRMQQKQNEISAFNRAKAQQRMAVEGVRGAGSGGSSSGGGGGCDGAGGRSGTAGLFGEPMASASSASKKRKISGTALPGVLVVKSACTKPSGADCGAESAPPAVLGPAPKPPSGGLLGLGEYDSSSDDGDEAGSGAALD